MGFFAHESERDGTFVGRLWSPDAAGPCVVTVRDGVVYDITTKAAPLVAPRLSTTVQLTLRASHRAPKTP